MASEGILPRVMKSTMQSLSPATEISLVGKVAQLPSNGQPFTINDAEGMGVTINTEDISDLEGINVGDVVEVVGQLQADGTVLQYLCIKYQGEFNFDNYKKLCQMWTGKYQNLFSGIAA